MDWNANLRSFLPRPESSLDFLYTYNYDQYPGMEIRHPGTVEKPHPHGLISEMDKNSYCSQEKKKRLTTDQLDSLERSFQEEIKLDPDRKMKLSRDLGLQPRQIAVWFQNRRARWKVKKLEVLYDALKQEFDIVSKEKQRLQEEVMKLKSLLREQATRKQVSTAGYTDISGEETVESTSLAIRSSNKPRGVVVNHHQNTNAAECNYAFNVDVYNNNSAVSSSLWGVIPSYP